MAAPPFTSNQANLRAQQRNQQQSRPEESIEPQSASGQNYRNLKQQIAQQKKQQEQNNEKDNDSFKNKAHVFLNKLLEKAWYVAPTTYGLSLIYVVFHWVVRYIAGVKLFPKFGYTFGKILPKGTTSEEAEKLTIKIIMLAGCLGCVTLLTMLCIILYIMLAPFKVLVFFALQKLYSVWKGILNFLSGS